MRDVEVWNACSRDLSATKARCPSASWVWRRNLTESPSSIDSFTYWDLGMMEDTHLGDRSQRYDVHNHTKRLLTDTDSFARSGLDQHTNLGA